jgi:hypothetical protein
MAIKRYGQPLVVDTAASLPSVAQAGDIAFAEDTKLPYAFNGTNFTSFGSQMGTLRGIQSSTSTPTMSSGAALGTGAPAITMEGNNVAGKITFTTAAVSLASGTILTMNFSDGLSFPNGCVCVFSAGNANFSLISNLLFVEESTTGVVLKTRAALGLGTTYIGKYHIIGY